MAEIKVISGELRAKAAELRQTNSQFKKAVEDMTSSEQQLMGMWDGEAKDTFHQAYNSDVQQMNTFYQAIEQYCQTLEQAATQYENTEKKNQNIASSRTYK